MSVEAPHSRAVPAYNILYLIARSDGGEKKEKLKNYTYDIFQHAAH